MRSRTGCHTCRNRKLKCDEVRPVCGPCRKSLRTCVPSDGVVFRHQQNASMNNSEGVQLGADGEPRGGHGTGGKLGGFYAYRNTFKEDHVWVDVPPTVKFFNITDPFNMEPTPEPETEPEDEYQDQDPVSPATNAGGAVNSTHQNTSPSQDPNQYREALHHGHPNRSTQRFMPQSSLFHQAPGLEALSAAATATATGAAPNYDYVRSVMSPGSQSLSISSSSNHLDFILNPTGPGGELVTPPIDPSLISSPTLLYPRNTSLPVQDHEVAFLLRHFAECTGQWMDLFDLGCYFAHQVPVRAVSNPLLRFSACAYAAKQLGRVRGRKATVGGLIGSKADMELFYRPETVDWEYLGAKYYDRAILLLLQQLSTSRTNGLTTPTADHPPSMTPRRASQSSHSPHHSLENRPRTQGNTADETLAAAAILCVYEFLDNANNAWSRHLNGTKSLFDLAENEGMMPVLAPGTPGAVLQRIKPSVARKATFWNFARQDFLAAFINEGQTRLNTEDLSLWRAAGLNLDDRGLVIPSNSETWSESPVMREDMISNALVWLLAKLINFLAAGDDLFPLHPRSPSTFLGVNQITLLERWGQLEKELDLWYRGLPDTFLPCARLLPQPAGARGLGQSSSPLHATFSEVWYSIPLCASAMQSYHMARIILLVNKPHESTARRTTLAGRLSSYRSIESMVKYHSHEILGIALGRPEGAVRIHAIQPLFVAGQCLADPKERKIIIDLLKGIESDLGWATDYRVQQLEREWLASGGADAG